MNDNLTISWIDSNSYYKISRSINGSTPQIIASSATTDFGSGSLLTWTDNYDYIIGINYSYTLEFCGSTTTCSVSRTFSFLIIDGDGDGLIDIESLTKLYNIRYNPAGTSYKTSSSDTGSTEGCPSGVCNGYELTVNLDFDRDGDGSTWTESSDAYSLDVDDSTSYFNTSNTSIGGWQAIPSFSAIFEGNGFAIRNLAAITSNDNLGLFGEIDTSAEIRSLNITNALFKNNNAAGTNTNFIATGILAGRSAGSISAVGTSGEVVAGAGSYDSVGGLVGFQEGGSITASDASGNVDGGAGDNDSVGGLVGVQQDGNIIVSYVTGSAEGGAGGSDSVGGLVGMQQNGSIIASYATGSAEGGAGGNDYVGGFVGWQRGGYIVASYATGSAEGGAGSNDHVGSFTGYNTGSAIMQEIIIASYASGNADGGTGNRDKVGRFIGDIFGRISFANIYGFGTETGEIITNMGRHNSVSTANGLTLISAGAIWNQANKDTLGAWDFGDASQSPALKFADYDGTDATMFACENDPASSTTDSTIFIPHCGVFLAGQGRTPVPSNIRLVASYANSRTSLTTFNNFSHKQSFGRVEIYNPATNKFGTVCRDSFDEADALVVCRSLGFNRGTILNAAQTPDGTGAILLDDLHCIGTENSLLECQHNGIGIHNCQHNEDVGVFCSY